MINHFPNFISIFVHRWHVAIKTNKNGSGYEEPKNTSKHDTPIRHCSDDNDCLSLLLEEAKTMWKVGAYHENIVNLQGITAREERGTLRKVG